LGAATQRKAKTSRREVIFVTNKQEMTEFMESLLSDLCDLLGYDHPGDNEEEEGAD
jgi:hypothetical protein